MRWLWVLGVLATAVLGGDPKRGQGNQFTWRQAGGKAARDSYRPGPDRVRWPVALWYRPRAKGERITMELER